MKSAADVVEEENEKKVKRIKLTENEDKKISKKNDGLNLRKMEEKFEEKLKKLQKSKTGACIGIRKKRRRNKNL
jgi:flagellar basal body rod protein FlgF